MERELHDAIAGVIGSNQFILGEYVQRFESSFARYCQAEHAIALNSGTSALHLALLACDVGPGDEVITTPFTFVATASAIRYCGARPVYVDIDPVTMNIDAAKVEAAITTRTKAILPVHLFGAPAALDALQQFGIPVVEDAAQAHGAEFSGKRVGSIGKLACFSFYPTKNLAACGEGGMVTTNDSELATRVRRLRDSGSDRKYHHIEVGYNYRMEGLQGAILDVKLKYLEAWTEQRRANAKLYTELLQGATVSLPVEPRDTRHVYHTYTIRSPHRDALQAQLLAQGIQTAIHYPLPTHLQPAYMDSKFPEGSLPEAERASREVLSLPMYPELPREHIEAVAHAVKNFSPDR